MQFLASRKVYLKDNNMVENQWVRIWSTDKKNKYFQYTKILWTVI